MPNLVVYEQAGSQNSDLDLLEAICPSMVAFAFRGTGTVECDIFDVFGIRLEKGSCC